MLTGLDTWRARWGLISTIVLRATLYVERLDDRMVPATFRWEPKMLPNDPTLGHAWSAVQNWEKLDPSGEFIDLREGDALPGVGDEVEFWPGGAFDCACFINDQNGISVSKITVKPGYTRTITVGGTIIFDGTPGSGLYMDGGFAQLQGATEGSGGATLIFAPGSTLEWKSGKLSYFNIDVQRDLDNAASVSLPAGGFGRIMKGVQFQVEGELDWSAGDIAVSLVPSGSSQVTILPTGKATLTASSTWGVQGVGIGNFTFANQGSLTVASSGTTVLGGNFTSVGKVQVDKGRSYAVARFVLARSKPAGYNRSV